MQTFVQRLLPLLWEMGYQNLQLELNLEEHDNNDDFFPYLILMKYLSLLRRR
jgi:hypothetical protein